MTGPRSKFTTVFDGVTLPYWGSHPGYYWPGGLPDGYTTIPGTVIRDELVTTQGNAYRDLGKGGRKIGGNFLAIKRELRDGSFPVRDYSGTGNPMQPKVSHYRGPVRPAGIPGISTGFPSPILPSESAMNVFGTTAIANTIPTNPVSGLFVALGELKRDGIPSLTGLESWRNRTNVARGAGSEYLNHQFGWLPLVSDMKKFTHAVRDHDSLVKQYERNSGRKIKRSFRVPISSSTVLSTDDAYAQPALSLLWKNTTNARFIEIATTQTIEMWFEGAYTYYLPPYKPNGDNTLRNEQLANYLYGTRPTPEGVWDLTPWTWAADWVVNAGDVLHNVGAFQQDGLVLLYGYVMYKSVHQKVARHSKAEFNSYPGEGSSLGYTATTTVKARFEATPYGFGLNPLTFSDRQWAILVALGLSRGNKQMR